MAIEPDNLVIYKSQKLTDASDGGGKYSGQVVVDGQSNNLFPDVSELDRTIGRVSVRKIFAGVNSADTDVLMGCTAYVSQNPEDPSVSALLFSTGSHSDTRVDAINRIESYLIKGATVSGKLLDTAYEGMTIVQMIMRQGDSPLSQGESIALVADEGEENEFVQYARILSVTTEQFTIDVSGQDRTYKQVVYVINTPLERNFNGVSAVGFFQNSTPDTIVRGTIVADSGRYYSSQNLAQDAVVGEFSVKANSMFSQIVPTAQVETPIIDVNPSGQNPALIPSRGGTISQIFSVNTTTNQSLYLGSSVAPTSVSFTLRGEEIHDDAGKLKKISGTQVATIDYQLGLIVWTSAAGAGTTSFTMNFTPAAAPVQYFQSTSRMVTELNQSLNWTGTILPAPSPTAFKISYMAQGNYYELIDDGTGRLFGTDSSFGTGTINYTTGTWLLTAGALPDIDTPILIQWGSNIATFERSDIAGSLVGVEFDLGNTSVSSVTIDWTQSGSPKTATADANGVISGDATGVVHLANGKGKMYFDVIPPKSDNVILEFNYSVKTSISQSVSTGTPTAGAVNFTIGTGAAISPNSVTLSLVVAGSPVELYDQNIDSTTGNIVLASTGEYVGTITYATGVIAITPKQDKLVYVSAYAAAST